jgi:hypothetical protein
VIHPMFGDCDLGCEGISRFGDETATVYWTGCSRPVVYPEFASHMRGLHVIITEGLRGADFECGSGDSN